MLDTHIQESLGSNVGRDTGYLDWGILLFPSDFPGKFRNSIFTQQRSRPSKFAISQSQ
jgi:hypothetical protein